MGHHVADYDSIPIDFVDGKGSYLIAKSGKKYLDFMGGWCVATVGWKHPEMAKAIAKQAGKGFYVPPIFRAPSQEALASLLVEHAPGNLNRVFRCTSGSEAVEFALKCARAASGKPGVVSINGVYHGHTYGALSVGDEINGKTGPGLASFYKLPMPKTDEEGERVIELFEELLDDHREIGTFLSEPFWTNAGCHIPPKDFYPRLQAICRKRGIVFVMDEVATGFRCGALFASSLQGLTPDIICLGKAFTGGYATMGATLVTEAVFRKSRGIPDYSTFGWLPQDLAAAAKNVELILRDRLHERAAETGAYLLAQLEPLSKLRKVKEVRGVGMVFGIEFTLPIAPIIALACARKGLLTAFANAHTLFFSPPLNLDRKAARQGADIIKAVCGSK